MENEALTQLSRKVDDAKNKLFFINETSSKLEDLAVNFDNGEENAAKLLAYEYSRVATPFTSLLHSIEDDIAELQLAITNLLK